jgi:hypothetical protein
MSKIEKMYENCGIYPDCKARECGLDYCANSSGCGYAVYPDFTAEKQIELICFLLNADIKIDICKEPNIKMGICDIAEALAEVTNTIWQDLTEEEKMSIKNILEI